MIKQDLVRAVIVGLVLMTVCSTLLGVMLGWWLRGEEVRRLKGKVEYLREELRKCWASKAKVTRDRGGNGKAG